MVCDIEAIAGFLEPILAFQDSPVHVERTSAILTPLITFSTSLEGAEEFRISNMSHRVKLLTGFYDVKFPYPSNFVTEVISPSAPFNYHGNKLYLVSNQGNVIHSGNTQHPSVLFRINEFLMSTLPILIKPREDERDIVIADGSSMREIELKLVDRWFEPVKIKNPMVVTIKMEPIMEEQVWYG
jgi:hypothetical protein